MTWPQKRLSDLGTWYGGSTPSKNEPAYWAAGTVPWLSPKDMGAEVLQGTRDHITDEAVRVGRAKVVPANSVAVVVRSGILDRTVPIAVVPFETTLNQDMKALSAAPDVDGRWVAWAIRSQERDILATDRKSGTTVASLDTAKLMSRKIPVPSLLEQRRIVDVLEDHLSRLDAAAAAIGRSDIRLQTLITSAYAQAMVSSGVKSGLGQLAVEASYGTSAKCSYDGLGEPVVRIPNVIDGRVDLADVKYVEDPATDVSGYRVRDGDLLIVRTNGSPSLIGRSAVVDASIDAAFASYLIRYRFNRTIVFPEWVHVALSAPEARATLESLAASSAGQYNLSVSKLNSVTIPVPSIPEQARLLSELAGLRGSSSRLRRALANAHADAASLRRALIAAAFSGQLTGRASDSDRIEELADASYDPR